MTVNWQPSGREERRERVWERGGGDTGGCRIPRAETRGSSVISGHPSGSSCRVIRTSWNGSGLGLCCDWLRIFFPRADVARCARER